VSAGRGLVVRGLAKRFGARPVLAGVDLTCDAPGVTALFGENGAGKSTLLALLAGVMVASGGEALLDGKSLFAAATRRALGYVPEAADAPPHLLPDELVDLVAGLKRAPRPPAALLDALGWSELAARRIGALSLGQRRRACLAAALVGDPRLLLLDEPSNGLDHERTRALVELLRARVAAGAIVIVATHDEALADALSARRLRLAAGSLSP
jgi:ABC-type multidrug transport system ATPase subunit